MINAQAVNMDIEKLSEPLGVDDLEFRVQSVNKGGYATLLVYKDARVDMQRLDNVVGHLNWKREHVNGNKNCIVSVWNDKTNQWVSKEDTGSESNAEAAKGLASDSFKRACFNWGIGRELYEYPLISVKLLDSELKNGKPSWNFKLKEWKWTVEHEKNRVSFVQGVDQNGIVRFTFGAKKPDATAQSWIDAAKSDTSVLNQIESADYRKYIESFLTKG